MRDQSSFFPPYTVICLMLLILKDSMVSFGFSSCIVNQNLSLEFIHVSLFHQESNDHPILWKFHVPVGKTVVVLVPL